LRLKTLKTCHFVIQFNYNFFYYTKNTTESIDVTGDVRIIIQPKTGEIIDICDIVTHSELY